MTKEYKSFAEFAADLAFDAAGMQAGLLEIGQRLEDRAKEKIGHYQEGWAQLAESTEAEKVAKGYPENAPLLGTGHLRDSISHELGENVVVIGSTDQTMVYHEFGTERMPPRPVFAGLVAENERFIIKTIIKYAARSFKRTGNWAPPTVIHQGPRVWDGKDDE